MSLASLCLLLKIFLSLPYGLVHLDDLNAQTHLTHLTLASIHVCVCVKVCQKVEHWLRDIETL